MLEERKKRKKKKKKLLFFGISFYESQLHVEENTQE